MSLAAHIVSSLRATLDALDRVSLNASELRGTLRGVAKSEELPDEFLDAFMVAVVTKFNKYDSSQDEEIEIELHRTPQATLSKSHEYAKKLDRVQNEREEHAVKCLVLKQEVIGGKEEKCDDQHEQGVRRIGLRDHSNFGRQVAEVTGSLRESCGKRKRKGVDRRVPAKGSKAFTISDDEKIIRALEGMPKAKGISWVMVADALKQRFTAAQIGQHYRRVLQPKLKGCQQGVWAPDEELRLHSVAYHCMQSWWVKVAQVVRTRCDVQCRYKWRTLAKASAVPWSALEDAAIIGAAQQCGLMGVASDCIEAKAELWETLFNEAARRWGCKSKHRSPLLVIWRLVELRKWDACGQMRKRFISP